MRRLDTIAHERARVKVRSLSLYLSNSPVVSQMVKVTLDPTASTAATVVCFSNDVDLYTCKGEMEGNYIFSLKYVPKISELTIFTKNSRSKTKKSRIYLKTQAKKLNFRHFRWISAKCTKKKPEIKEMS